MSETLTLFRVHVDIDGQRRVIEKMAASPEAARKAVTEAHRDSTLRFGPTKVDRQQPGKQRRPRKGDG